MDVVTRACYTVVVMIKSHFIIPFVLILRTG